MRYLARLAAPFRCACAHTGNPGDVCQGISYQAVYSHSTFLTLVQMFNLEI